MTEEADPSSFAVECMNLWRAGNVYIASAGAAYALASQHLSHTYERVDEAATFANSRSGGCSAAYSSWQDLRDMTQAILGRTAENLYAVGEALGRAAYAFAEADTDNGNSIGSAVDQLDELVEAHRSEVAADARDPDWDDLANEPIVINPDIPESEIVDQMLPESTLEDGK